MNDSVFIFLTIFVVTGSIYFLYKVMLNSEKGCNDSDLQISSEDILAQLNILYRQKRHNIVESLAKNYLEKKGGDDGVRTILTKSLYDSGRVYEAMDQAKVIIRHRPNNFDMQIFMANCYLEIEKPMKAIEIYQHILEKDYGNVVAIKDLAKAYLKTNQKKAAMEMYKRLEEFLESNHEKAKNKAIVAEIHLEYREIDLAINEYEQILEIYPEDIKIKKRLIELYKLMPDYYDSLVELANEMVADYAEDESGLWALNMLMEFYKTLQDYEKALNYADLIKNHHLSNKNKVDEDIAKIMFDEGRFDDSIAMLEELATKEPQNIGIKKELAKAYEAKEDFESAIDIYKKILDIANARDIEKIHFEISNIYSNWAMHSFSQNENDDCFKHFITALKYNNQNPDVYYRLGNVNKMIKNFNESISQYKRAIEIDPKNPDYYAAIAESYEGVDSIYEQKKALIECLKYNPDDAKINYKLGIIYNIQNDQATSMLHIKKAIELDDTFIEAKRKLALMFEHIGDTESAIELYEDILKLDPENKDILNNLEMLKG